MEEETERLIAGCLLARPLTFAGKSGKRYRIRPLTLGKILLTEPLWRKLGLNSSKVTLLGLIGIVSKHREDVCRLLAMLTTDSREKLLDEDTIKNRTEEIAKDFSDRFIVQIFQLLPDTDVQKITKALGLDREQKERNRIAQYKAAKGGSKSYGGKSIYGSVIDWACERYGWTLEYVLWGIDYANLRMLMADTVTSIYLSKEESNELHISTDNVFIDASKKENIAKILSMDWH